MKACRIVAFLLCWMGLVSAVPTLALSEEDQRSAGEVVFFPFGEHRITKGWKTHGSLMLLAPVAAGVSAVAVASGSKLFTQNYWVQVFPFDETTGESPSLMLQDIQSGQMAAAADPFTFRGRLKAKLKVDVGAGEVKEIVAALKATGAEITSEQVYQIAAADEDLLPPALRALRNQVNASAAKTVDLGTVSPLGDFSKADPLSFKLASEVLQEGSLVKEVHVSSFSTAPMGSKITAELCWLGAAYGAAVVLWDVGGGVAYYLFGVDRDDVDRYDGAGGGPP